MEKEIIEGNKLIAEFMGIKLNGGGTSIFDEPSLKYFRKTTYEQDGLCKYCHNNVTHGHNIKCYVLDTDKLLYHSSWNLLMPVVEKIERTPNASYGYEFSKKGKRCVTITDVSTDSDIVVINITSVNTFLEATWLAVIAFIQWHNENEKQIN